MVDDITGVSFAQGRGFDSRAEAQEWVDSFIRRNHPGRIAALRAQADDLESELEAARGRM